jgi:hypothetical protein
MQALIPKLVNARSPLSLKQMCLRVLVGSSHDVSALPWDVSQALLEECQNRFALENDDSFKRFFSVPIRAWTARETFLEERGLFDDAITAWGGSLTSLELWSVRLPPESLASITQRLPHLVRLSLCRVPGLTDSIASELFSESFSSRVHLLSLVDLSHLTDKGLSRLRESCLALESLQVEKCAVLESVLLICKSASDVLCELRVDVANNALGSVLLQCKKLTVLELSHGDVTDRSMKPLLRSLAPRLLRLSLSHTAVSCESLEALRSGAQESEEGCDLPLRVLDLSLLYNVTKVAVEGLLYLCANLQSLSLKDNDEVDDETVDIICTWCSQLRELDLSKCNKITDIGVAQIVAELTDLTDLNVRKCEHVSAKMNLVLARLHLSANVVKK